MNEKGKDVALKYFSQFTKYSLYLLSNNSLYQNYKMLVCNSDEDFNKVFLGFLHRFRVKTQYDTWVSDSTLVTLKFDDYIRSEYNRIKEKSEKNEDEEYFTENFLHFALASDVFLFGVLKLD